MNPEPDDADSATETETTPPKVRKPSLLDKLRARKKARPAAVETSGDDESDPTADPDRDPSLDDPEDDPQPRPKSAILSGRRARAAAAVGLSVVVLAGALAYPKLFPKRAAKPDQEPESEQSADSGETSDAREARPPVVAAIPTGRDARPPAPPDEPDMLPDPASVVPPTQNGVRLASADQPEPLDEPAPLPAAAANALPPADEPIPLPADALTPSGGEQARNRLDEPPPLDTPAPSELPPPVEVPSTPPAPSPTIANTRPTQPQQPPSLLNEPAPAPAPALAPPPASAPAADLSNFVTIPNTRKARGAAVAGAAAAGSLAMASNVGGPASRSRPAMDQPSTLEPVVPESVEPILHRVGSGQNFQTISYYYYATTRYWKALWAANQAVVPAPEQLAVGMTIKVPMVEELDARYVGPETPAVQTAPEPMTIRSTPRTGRVVQSRFDPANDPPRRVGKPTYTVRRNGETLRSIARDLLGDVSRAQEIQELNAERLDGSPALRAGFTLRLPDDAQVRPEQP